jgi:hypothetical protein
LYPIPKTIPHQQHKYASWQAFLTLYFQQFRANRIIKQCTPPASFFKQTREPSTPTWVEAHWDTWDSSSQTRPTLWTIPQAPGAGPSNTDGTAAQISAASHIWEEDVHPYWTCPYVQQALKKQIISVFEKMYVDILNDNMVGYVNISA